MEIDMHGVVMGLIIADKMLLANLKQDLAFLYR